MIDNEDFDPSLRSEVDRMLKEFFSMGASDLHIVAEDYPIFRIKGKLKKQEKWGIMYREKTIKFLNTISSQSISNSVLSGTDTDFSYRPQRDMENWHSARYRVSACMAQERIRIVMRRAPSSPPYIEDLRLPTACTEAIRTIRKGLILITGPTGSGKSSSFAAWIRDLLENGDSEHIITIEDPIEYEFESVERKKGSFITQREKNTDFENFPDAMRTAMRQDPDIIMIGELRDKDTVDLALQAADSGHLVLATLHSNDVAGTVSRLASVYPLSERNIIMRSVLEKLSLVMTQRLESRWDGTGRVGIHEYLIISPAMRAELRELTRDEEISGKMASYVKNGGSSMIDCALNRYMEGVISADTFNSIAASLQDTTRITEEKSNNKK